MSGAGCFAGRDVLSEFARLTPIDRARVMRDLPVRARAELAWRWRGFELDGQAEPAGDWRVWMIRAGRGFGKTRAGAEWVSAAARARPGARIALVGATAADALRVMVEGPSGLIAVARFDERVRWRSTRAEVAFASGAVAFVYSAETPDALRGPEHDFAWCDELAKWRNAETTWDNLQMGMRRGARPRVLVTTTPRPTPLMRRLLAAPDLVETRGRTADNPHLPASFVEAMVAAYGDTRLGRQELDGEMIDDVAGALWTRATIEACRVAAPPADPRRVVIGVDPPAGTRSGTGGDACGIVAVALGDDDRGYVIEDASVAGASPEGWAAAVAGCAERHGADLVVAEANQGGTMVSSVLLAADAALPVTLVHASRGKAARAEPVATLYDRGKVFHAGRFPALEDELCGLVAGGGYQGPGRSPDRADAAVWALTALMLRPKRTVAVRRV